MRKSERRTPAERIGGRDAQEQGEQAKLKFRGSLARLQDTILLTGIYGEWDERPNGIWRFRCEDRAGMNWSSTKGTVWFDGPTRPRERLQDALVSSLRAGGGGLFRS